MTDDDRPSLTSRAVADQLGVSQDFVVGEILDGRLRASVLARPGKRRIYRVSPRELEAYKRRFGWNTSTG